MQRLCLKQSKGLTDLLARQSHLSSGAQPLQQELSISQKQLLAEIGDTLSLARTSSIDSVGFFENQNLYKIVTVNGYDSVLIYSVDPDSAYVRATFEFVGAQNGDYRVFYFCFLTTYSSDNIPIF